MARSFKQGRCTIKVFADDSPHMVYWGVNGKGKSGHVERLVSGKAYRGSEALKLARKAALRAGCGGKKPTRTLPRRRRRK